MTVLVERQYLPYQRMALDERNGGKTLFGIAAPFDTWTDLGNVRERITYGAFTRSLSAGTDILALADHNRERLLGRTGNGTLELSETTAGLHYRLRLPDTSLGNDLRTLALDGTLGGISIGFLPGKRRTGHNEQGAWQIWDTIDLREVSVVQAFPAYPQTTVAVRTLKERFKEWLYWNA